jgi:hypothetical protein
MATDAQGRQLSEDGYYYWDGAAWQPVQQDGGGQGTDGGTGGAANFNDAFAQAMGQAGHQIDAGVVPDAATLQSGLDAARQWYDNLDATTKSAIDAATAEPGQAAVALSEAGIASDIHYLLQAFDQIQGTLGDLLQAAGQALSTAQQGAAQPTNQ